MHGINAVRAIEYKTFRLKFHFKSRVRWLKVRVVLLRVCFCVLCFWHFRLFAKTRVHVIAGSAYENITSRGIGQFRTIARCPITINGRTAVYIILEYLIADEHFLWASKIALTLIIVQACNTVYAIFERANRTSVRRTTTSR